MFQACLIKRKKRTCSSREQIYLLCPHMEVTQDVKLECKSYITIISHLDIPISVMSERPFLVLFMSLPKQFKTTGKTTFVFLLKKETRGGVTEVTLQGFPSTCLPKFNTPGRALLELTWQKAACPPSYLPAYLPTHLGLHLPRRNLPLSASPATAEHTSSADSILHAELGKKPSLLDLIINLF